MMNDKRFPAKFKNREMTMNMISLYVKDETKHIISAYEKPELIKMAHNLSYEKFIERQYHYKQMIK